MKSCFLRIREWWQLKSFGQKWDFILNIGIFAGHLIGVRTFSDMKVNWYSASGGVAIILFFSLNFYTIQYYLRFGAFVRGMECTYLVGVVIGVRETNFSKGTESKFDKFYVAIFRTC